MSDISMSDSDDNIDFDDVEFEPSSITSNLQNQQLALMDPKLENQFELTQGFVRIFKERYGDICPHFFCGTMKEALRTSLLCKVEQRKMMLIYIHTDTSIFANVFCSQILCKPQIVDIINTNCLVYPWDVSSSTLTSLMHNLFTDSLGKTASNSIRSIDKEKYPLVLVLSRQKGSNEILAIMKASEVGSDEFLEKLQGFIKIFKEVNRNDLIVEREQVARINFKTAQDSEYQESLRIDKEKEAVKQAEKRILDSIEKDKENEIIEQEKIRKIAQNAYEEEKKKKIQNMPIEPNDGPKTTLIRFRSSKRTFKRRFHIHDPLSILLDYTFIEGYTEDEYKFLTSYPRRNLTSIDNKSTFEELKMFPQQLVIIELRN